MQAGREIKFRAWDKENKAMRYGAEQAYNGHWQMNDIQYFGQLIDNPKYELMQFTGLRDRNGKEIYEGDIVRVHPRLVENQDSYTAKIVWRDSGFDLERVDFNWIGIRFANKLNENAEVYEIIGNIYKNPELLEVGN